MTDEQAKLIAKNEVREYFDQFLTDVLPAIIERQIANTPQIQFISRFKWTMIGMAIAAGIFIPSLGMKLLSIIQ